MFAKFQQRPGNQPAPPRSDVLSVRLIQAIPFQTITHSTARRPTPIPFSFNHFRTLCAATEGVPSLLTLLAPTWCNLSSFKINTYGPLRICCKQKAYTKAKPFSCNTYKKHGGAGSSLVFSGFQRVSTRVFDLSPFLSHSCALFGTAQKLNPFVFRRFRTLCAKTPGVGVSPIPFIQTITCPEGVHRTYYWSREFAPPSYSQVTVPSFPSTFIYVGGCDG